MEDMLYSLVNYELILDSNALDQPRSYGKSRPGVLLRIKYDNYYQDYILLVRMLHVKSNQKERTDWL